MGEQRLNHFMAKRVTAHYWTQTDGFVLPLFGLVIFGVIAWLGIAFNRPEMFWLALPIATFMLFLILADLWLLYYEKHYLESEDSKNEE